MSPTDSLPTDLASAHALILAQRQALSAAEAKARSAEAEVRARELMIEQMKFTIAKLRHEQFGQSSERSAVLEQLELQLADMEEDASEAEAAARMAAQAAASQKITIAAFERRRPARRPLPEHLPRERIVYASRLSGGEQQSVMLVLITMQKLAASSIAAVRHALQRRLDRIEGGASRLAELEARLKGLTDLQQRGNLDDLDQISGLEEEIVALTTLRLMEDEAPRLALQQPQRARPGNHLAHCCVPPDIEKPIEAAGTGRHAAIGSNSGEGDPDIAEASYSPGGRHLGPGFDASPGQLIGTEAASPFGAPPPYCASTDRRH